MELKISLGWLGAGTNSCRRLAATGSKQAVGIWLPAKIVEYDKPAEAPTLQPGRPFKMLATVWLVMEPVRPVAEKSPPSSAGDGTTTGSEVTPTTWRLPS